MDQLHRVLIMILANTKDAETTGKLIEFARGKRPEAARLAVDVLGQAKIETAAPALRDLAKVGSSPAIKAAALKALGDMGDDQSADLWVAGLADKDKEVRRVSVTYLGGLGRVQDVKPVIAVLKDPDTEVGLAALAALANYKKSTEAIGMLHDALKINDDKVQRRRPRGPAQDRQHRFVAKVPSRRRRFEGRLLRRPPEGRGRFARNG